MERAFQVDPFQRAVLTAVFPVGYSSSACAQDTGPSPTARHLTVLPLANSRHEWTNIFFPYFGAAGSTRALSIKGPLTFPKCVSTSETTSYSKPTCVMHCVCTLRASVCMYSMNVCTCAHVSLSLFSLCVKTAMMTYML